MAGDDDDSGFLSRWSRRKRGGAAEEPPQPSVGRTAAAPVAQGPDRAADVPGRADGTDPAAEAGSPADAASPGPPAGDEACDEACGEARDEAEVLAELGLPVPETLKRGDDFAAFMARAVPEAIRQRALRQLWRSDPILACVDGLNDYDGDFTGGGVPIGTLKSAYQAGRGYLSAAIEQDVDAGDVTPGEIAPADISTADISLGDADPAAMAAGDAGAESAAPPGSTRAGSGPDGAQTPDDAADQTQAKLAATATASASVRRPGAASVLRGDGRGPPEAEAHAGRAVRPEPERRDSAEHDSAATDGDAAPGQNVELSQATRRRMRFSYPGSL